MLRLRGGAVAAAAAADAHERGGGSEDESDGADGLGEDSATGGERWFAHISAQQAGSAGRARSADGGSPRPPAAADARGAPGAPGLCGGGGSAVSWGIGLQGRLGSGDWIDRFEPCRALAELRGELTQISAGDYHALALSRNGSVFAFGSNGRCQLGDGSKTHRSSVQMVADLDEGFVKVAAGGLHSLALHAEGFVLAWGDNTTGQVGQSICPFEDEAEIRHRGWPVHVATPVIPRFLDENVVDIAAGQLHSLALLADGRILAWGGNIYGELGTGKNLSWPPYDAEGEDDLASRSDAFRRSRLECMVVFENLPMKVRMPALTPARKGARVSGAAPQDGVLKVTKIAAGAWHSLALVSADGNAAVEGQGGARGLGGVYAWGSNYHGQLGNGFFTSWNQADEELQDSSSTDSELSLTPKPKSRRAGAKRDALSSWVSEVKELEGARPFAWGDAQEGGDLSWPAEECARGKGGEGAWGARGGLLERGGWRDLLEPRLCLRRDSLESPIVDVVAGYEHSLGSCVCV